MDDLLKWARAGGVEPSLAAQEGEEEEAEVDAEEETIPGSRQPAVPA